jgi:hypothetical protein
MYRKEYQCSLREVPFIPFLCIMLIYPSMMDSQTAATGTILPGSLLEDDARRIVGPLTEFQTLWRNRTGGVSFLQEPSSKNAVKFL